MNRRIWRLLLSSPVLIVSLALCIRVFVGASHASTGSSRHATAPPRLTPPTIALDATEQAAARHFPVFTGAVPIVVVGALHAGNHGAGMSVLAFARELALLKLAGFRTISSAQLAAFLDDRGALPPRPLLICVDGSAGSAWRIADPILARDGMHAELMVDPFRVSDQNSYYLSWSELTNLARSSRWELGLLAQPQERQETLELALARLHRHSLNAAAALAFSHEPDSDELATVASLRQRFRTVLADTSFERFAAPLDRKEPLPRITLPRHSADLLPRLAALAPRSAVIARFAGVAPWVGEGTGRRVFHQAALELEAAPRRWIADLSAPAASSGWRDYGVNVTVAGLSPGTTATLLLRAFSQHRLTINLSDKRLTAAAQLGQRRLSLGRARLKAEGRHVLEATVAGPRLVVAVDGDRKLEVLLPAGFERGGIGFGAWHTRAGHTPIGFSILRVAQVGARTKAPSRPSATDSGASRVRAGRLSNAPSAVKELAKRHRSHPEVSTPSSERRQSERTLSAQLSNRHLWWWGTNLPR